MQQIEEGVRELVIKIALFVIGLIIGIGTKIASMHKAKRLTMAEAIYRTCVALMTAWIAWFVFEIRGWGQWAPAAAAICGRFGDEILIWIWKIIVIAVENIIKKKADE